MEFYMKQQLWITALLYIGQILVGYGLGWSAPVIPKLRDPEQSPLLSQISETETSLIGSLVTVGSIIGPYVTGYLCNKIGRKPCFGLAGLLNLISFLILANARNLAMIYAGRVICGLGLGITYVVNLVYIGEIASTNIRGILLISIAVFTTFGTLLVYSVGPYVTYPVVSYVAVGIATVYLIGILLIPESPVYFILKDRKDDAKHVMNKLGRSKDYKEIEAMKSIIEKQSTIEEWKQILTIKSNRKALFITLTLGILQQGSGFLAVTFFVTTIFELAGSSIEPAIATIIIGFTQTSSSALMPLFVERVGRKILLICSTAACSLSLAVLGVYFFLDHIHHPSVYRIQWLPLVTLVTFFLAYDLGFGMIPGTFTGEMYRSNVRGTGSTVSVTGSWLFGFGVSTSFGYMVSNLGSHVTFWIFSSMCAMATAFTVIFVPETKGKTLLEIQDMLNK